MNLPDCMRASVIMRPTENVSEMWQARYSEKFSDPQKVGALHGGYLLLTSERLMFVEKKGVISKSYSPVLTIELDNIAGCSVVGTIGKKLKVNTANRPQGEPPLFYSLFNVEPATLKITGSVKLTDVQNSVSAAIAGRLSDKEEEKKRARIQYVLDFSFLKAEMEKGGIVVQTIKCPNCNANVALPSTGTSMKCQYCGSVIQAYNVFEKMKGLIGGM